jgi:hypothetical protein
MPNEKRTCPCKALPLCLSSFTAAEFGDLHSLSKAGPNVIHRTDPGGYTPLHLAAQNGHVVATAFLLNLGANVEGSFTCGASPLHRASFSGAVATMRLLVEAKADLLAKDISFGDRMTPLHKAMAGGRYLAVQLLLDALRSRQQLQEALSLMDACGRTPMQVGLELRPIQREERESVQRWDEVAGGQADWERCVQLLQSLPAMEQSTTTICASSATMASLPQHLMNNAADCLDCDESINGKCLTASWESSFRSVLLSSVSSQLQQRTSVRTSIQDTGNTGFLAPLETLNSRKQPTNAVFPKHLQILRIPDPPLAPRGKPCASCGKECFAVFRSKVGTGLVCRVCFNDTK